MIASWALLASALSLLAAGTLYADAVTLAGLHRELLSAPPADRAIVVRTRILPDRLATARDAVVPELQRSLSPTGGEVAEVLQASAYADAAADPATVTDLEQPASFEGIERHAVLVDGRWAEAGRTPIEATLSQAAAAAIGVKTGDTLSLANRLDAGRVVDMLITGTWRADPADPYWLGDPLVLDGAETSGRFTTRGPLVVAAADLTTGPLSEPLDAQWRAIPEVTGFRPETLDAVGTDIAGLRGRVNAALPGSSQASVSTQLPDILASVDRSVLVAQAGILLLLVQFGVLAAYAVILVAALLLERRRTETALLRSRGAGTGHLAAMAFGEALLVVVPAVIAAPWLAVLLVQAVRLNPAMEGVGLSAPLPGPSTYATAVLGGIVALVALTLPTLLSGVSIAGVRAAIGRQGGRTLPQRLGLDLALIVLAVIAMLQLRLYGATLTRTARGTLGVDPLLVAAPAIGLIGGAVLAIRIVPRLAELAERVARPDARVDRVAPRPPDRAPAAPLHPGGAAADPRGGVGDVRVRPRRDLDPQPGGPGGVDRRLRRPHGARPAERHPTLGARRRAAGRPGRDGGDPGRARVGRPRVDDPRRDAGRHRRVGDGRRRAAARGRGGRDDARRPPGARRPPPGDAGPRPARGHATALDHLRLRVHPGRGLRARPRGL